MVGIYMLCYIVTVYVHLVTPLTTGNFKIDIEVLPDYQPYERDCPSHRDNMIDNVQRPWGEPDRAYKTLPGAFAIKNSTIPKAGLGVFSYRFIPAYTWLGEYEGEITDHSHISAYAWQVSRNGEADYYIDGADVETSSWQRFVNCPVHHQYENVVIHECRGRVYYMAGRDVYPGEELFVYYGPKYLQYLGIDVHKYYNDLPQTPGLASITINVL